MTVPQPRWLQRLRRTLIQTILCSIPLLAAAMGDQPLQRGAAQALGLEAQLVRSLVDIRHNRLDAARAEIDRLIAANPNFRLAHLIRGDLLLARSRPLSSLGNAEGAPTERVDDLRAEARVRVARFQSERPGSRIPRYLVQMHPEQKHALIMDASRSTLYVFENVGNTPRYVADYYVTVGRNGVEKLKSGDKKTPLGVYHVVDEVPKARLPDFYGGGAYPISYPNEWDRRQGRNGHGIWVHGTPSDTYSRPPRASDGCVVLSNADLETVSRTLQIGLTPIIIADAIDWASPESIIPVRRALAERMEQWRRDWESLDSARYLKNYSPNFATDELGFAEWSRQKARVNASKQWVKVKVSGVSIFLYPGHDNLAVIDFEQEYSSSNLSNRMKKRQYWAREGGAWKIVYEGAG